jgi:integrase
MLTDTQCRNAKPTTKPYKLSDTHGLYLEVRPNGTKAWRYRFKLPKNGKLTESTFAIGDYGLPPAGELPEETATRRAGGRYSLTEAREERAKARGLVRQGINPAQNRQLERLKREHDDAYTFEAVAREWIGIRDWEEITKGRRLDMLERVVFPTLGNVPIKLITPAHVLAVLKAAASNNGPSVAAEAQRTMSGVFDLAVSTLRADTNPVHPVRQALPRNKTQHKRALTVGEIGQLLRDFEAHGSNFQTQAAFRLMWLTLCRPTEVAEAEWTEFDLDAALWRIPARRMKKRKEHLVSLPSQAIDLLRAMFAITGRGTHVFPNRDDRRRPMSAGSFRQALKVIGWAGRYSPHATRTTGSTHLNELGYASDWIERQLAHGEPNSVRRTYNHATHIDDRAKMMQEWADKLDMWKAPPEAEIVEFKRSAG